jgi:ABC-2 type transport system ATP-binding protein
MSSSIVSVSNLSKAFPEVKALNGVNLNVEPGIFGLMGPNGAGKTTLLRILLNLSQPDSGKACVFGLDCQRESLEIREKIGVLHENPFYPKTMTPISYLDKVSKLYHSDASTEELLMKVGLSDASNRPIGKLSAGMHQRLGIAQALVGKPELVFLDEPTSNLDVNGREDIVGLIIKMHQDENISFFISSHILSELEKACHNVAFIKAGQIIMTGSAINIIKKYTSTSFRIVVSDSNKLFKVIENMRGLISASISGVNSITIRIEKDSIDRIRQEIERIAGSYGIEVYSFEKANTLEEAYRSIMNKE